jgi:hypothetical protein
MCACCTHIDCKHAWSLFTRFTAPRSLLFFKGFGLLVAPSQRYAMEANRVTDVYISGHELSWLAVLRGVPGHERIRHTCKAMQRFVPMYSSSLASVEAPAALPHGRLIVRRKTVALPALERNGQGCAHRWPLPILRASPAPSRCQGARRSCGRWRR